MPLIVRPTYRKVPEHLNPSPYVNVNLANSDLFAIVSPDDFDRVSAHKWRLLKSGRKMYARASIKGRDFLMHRFILDASSPSVLVDHVDANGLNNTRGNIRFATPSQNRWNVRVNSLSGFRGVVPSGNGWMVKFVSDGNTIYGGMWKTAIEAALAYNDMALQARGDWAELNVVDPDAAKEILSRRIDESQQDIDRARRWLKGAMT